MVGWYMIIVGYALVGSILITLGRR